MNRRGFLTGALGFLAAPAIVRASSLMPVSVQPIMVQCPPPIMFSFADSRAMWLLCGDKVAFYDWVFDAGAKSPPGAAFAS